MRINYVAGMRVSDTKKYSHQIEGIIEDEWRDKASKLQSRRWKKIHNIEMGRIAHSDRHRNYR